AEAYMQGPLADLNALLSASSMADLSDRVELVAAVQRHDEDLATQAAARRTQLGVLVRAQSKLLNRQAAAVRRVDGRTQILSAAFQSQQAALADLASARREASRLVRSLRTRLSAEQLAAVVPSSGGGMSITYGQWAERFLVAL